MVSSFRLVPAAGEEEGACGKEAKSEGGGFGDDGEGLEAFHSGFYINTQNYSHIVRLTTHESGFPIGSVNPRANLQGGGISGWYARNRDRCAVDVMGGFRTACKKPLDWTNGTVSSFCKQVQLCLASSTWSSAIGHKDRRVHPQIIKGNQALRMNWCCNKDRNYGDYLLFHFIAC